MTPGVLREARGHRHVGGHLGGARPCGLGEVRERHYVAAIVAAVVAAIASATTAYAASEQQAAAQRYQAKVAKNQAINARNLAAAEANRRRDLYARQQSAQRAAMGTSGIIQEEGSSLLVQMDAAEQAALDIANVRYQGEVQSTQFEAERRLHKFQAKSAERMGYVQAGASLLKGAAGAYGAYAGGGTTRVHGGVNADGTIY